MGNSLGGVSFDIETKAGLLVSCHGAFLNAFGKATVENNEVERVVEHYFSKQPADEADAL